MEVGTGLFPLCSRKTFQVSHRWGSQTAAGCPNCKQQPLSELLADCRNNCPEGMGNPLPSRAAHGSFSCFQC